MECRKLADKALKCWGQVILWLRNSPNVKNIYSNYKRKVKQK